MSGALRKMTNFLGYSEPAEGPYEPTFAETESFADSYEEATTQASVAPLREDYEAPAQTHSYDDYADYSDYEEPAAPADLRRIVTVHPTTYNDAQIIGQSFRDGVPVIVNLTNMSEADARRMVDFSAGLVFGLRGAIERVTPRVFLLTPGTVEIDSGDGVSKTPGRFFNQG